MIKKGDSGTLLAQDLFSLHYSHRKTIFKRYSLSTVSHNVDMEAHGVEQNVLYL